MTNAEWTIPEIVNPEQCETCKTRPVTVEVVRGGEGNEDRTLPLCAICNGHAMLVRALPATGADIWAALAQAERDGHSDVVDRRMEDFAHTLFVSLEGEEGGTDRATHVLKSVQDAMLAIRAEEQGTGIPDPE